MNCAEARFLISMNRPGERTASQEAFLQKHLLECAECSEWQEQFDRNICKAVESVRQEPVFDRPVDFTRAILEKTVDLSGPGSEEPWIDRMLSPALRPAVRQSLLGAVAVIVCTFVLESYSTLLGVRNVETILAFRQPSAQVYTARLAENIDQILSAKSTATLLKSLGIAKVDELISALSSRQRAQLVEAAKRQQASTLRPITERQLTDLVRSASR
jgi:hypothetical protein